ncbi:AzlD domain-containing protein [Falsarthrobacter nasiphocae]|uniref:Membrane protein n=1 Tax=Falsarthrobacter nasiphocae TaxID=189863 RepID=A0AAE3YDN0_9MICC|nr:AzlD domain-containing protein [Falsarthrobacter nasiphocae]MDR6891933.1 putative membrane protein [Falsarthrobacter nasiphocae]
MSQWIWIIAACAAAFATKFVGYLVPERFLEDDRVLRISQFMTAGLLAALVVTNAFASGPHLVIDARVVALAAAAIALWLRAPFIVVVIIGALAAAGARALGMG